MISIRRAASADAAPIAALTLQLGYPADEAAIRTRLSQLLPDPAQLVLVAESDDTIIGWLHAHAYTALEAGPQVEIVGLVVSTRHQRCGAGRALVAESPIRKRRPSIRNPATFLQPSRRQSPGGGVRSFSATPPTPLRYSPARWAMAG